MSKGMSERSYRTPLTLSASIKIKCQKLVSTVLLNGLASITLDKSLAISSKEENFCDFLFSPLLKRDLL